MMNGGSEAAPWAGGVTADTSVSVGHSVVVEVVVAMTLEDKQLQSIRDKT